MRYDSYDFYAWVYNWQSEKNKDKILKEITQSLPEGTKRETEIKRRIKESKLNKETKSKFWHYKIKELALHKTYFQSIGKKKSAEDVRTAYKWYILPYFNAFSEMCSILGSQSSLEIFNITREFSTPQNLPKYSTFIQIKFKLKKPFLSKDDDNFYIIDNPIAKDKVFKLPMVRASTWKGALRFAAIKVFEEWIYANKSKLDKEKVFKERARIVKLFGNEKDAMENYLGKLTLSAISDIRGEIAKINNEFEEWLIRNNIISRDVPSGSGRLFFYPTFFDVISLDVITPLSRETKTPVRGPIYFEIVPEKIKTENGEENVKGAFRVLYYPYDLVARGEFDKIKKELNEDIEFLAKALKKMFYEIGFSAKKTSGFGVVMPISDENVRVDGFEIDKVEEKLSILYTKVNKNVNHGESK